MEQPKKTISIPKERKAKVMNALKAMRTTTSTGSMAPEDLERQRKGQNVLGHLVAPMLGIGWEPFQLGDIPAAWARPERGHGRHNVILYCHGGGYTSGNLGYARILAAKLAHATGYDVLTFSYRLAPEHPYPAPLEDAMQAWDYLMHQGYGARDVVLVGDSAGGNLALVLTMMLRDAGRMLPKRLVLLSPWTDMTVSGQSHKAKEADDPILSLAYLYNTRDAYAQGVNYTAPLLSPLFGDFTQFPPVLIQVGDRELLLSDSIRLRDRLMNSGIPCRLEVWKDLWHVFQLMPGKKSAQAMDHIGDFLLNLY